MISETNDKKTSVHSCPKCEKNFERPRFLKNHLEFVHQGIVKNKCSSCGMCFERHEYLKRHVRDKHLEKKFQCESCAYKTAIKANLDTHRRTHTGEKPFACEQCPLRFSDESYFKQHLKIHSGEIKVSCKYCQLQFNKTYIKTHIQSKHSGVSTKRHWEYSEEVKQLAIKLAEEVGVFQAAKTLNLKVQAVRKWKSGITEYLGPTVSDKDRLTCRVCHLSLTTRYLLKKHLKEVHGEKVNKREIINYPENFRREVAYYAVKHGQEIARDLFKVNPSTLRDWITCYCKPLACSKCEKTFARRRDLENHMKVDHNGCIEDQIDLDALKNKAEILINSKRQEDKMEFQAKEEMSPEYKHFDDIVKHFDENEDEHSDVKMEIMPEIQIKEEVKEDVNYEEEDFKTEPWLDRISAMTILTFVSLYHLHHGKQNRISCFIQLFKYRNAIKKGLIPHLNYPVPDTFTDSFMKSLNKKKKKGPEPKQESYTCETCGKIFKYKYYYDRHLVVHTGDKSHVCPQCGKSFGWRSILLKHMDMHNGVKYPCPECGKQFSQEGAILTHYRSVHEKREQKYVCEDCGKEMKDINVYRAHKYDKHVDISKKTCDVCNSVFASVTGLRKHQKAKQGKCNEKDPLLQHNCPECGKYFEKKGNMKVHVKTVHYGLKEFQCQKCELCFFTKRNLQVHEEKVHPELRESWEQARLDLEAAKQQFQAAQEEALRQKVQSMIAEQQEKAMKHAQDVMAHPEVYENNHGAAATAAGSDQFKMEESEVSEEDMEHMEMEMNPADFSSYRY